jgi:hypothetical protein
VGRNGAEKRFKQKGLTKSETVKHPVVDRPLPIRGNPGIIGGVLFHGSALLWFSGLARCWRAPKSSKLAPIVPERSDHRGIRIVGNFTVKNALGSGAASGLVVF